MTNSEDAQVTSNSSNVPEILRRIVRDGSAWPSAGIIGEAANLLDDVDLLLSRLAECFGDDETEFADIKLMRDRIAAVDTRDRHDATDESARRHSHETFDGPTPHHIRYDTVGWLCSVCGGWNRDTLLICSHTHATYEVGARNEPPAQKSLPVTQRAVSCPSCGHKLLLPARKSGR